MCKKKPLHQVRKKQMQTLMCKKKIQGTKTLIVKSVDVFPIVEDSFGPLRVPLPTRPRFLDLEYGNQWRDSLEVKKIGKDGRAAMMKIPTDMVTVVRRTIWPSVALSDAKEFEDGYAGASLHASSNDVAWRYRKATEYDNGQSQATEEAQVSVQPVAP